MPTSANRYVCRISAAALLITATTPYYATWSIAGWVMSKTVSVKEARCTIPSGKGLCPGDVIIKP